jgi:hypothetical protein
VGEFARLVVEILGVVLGLLAIVLAFWHERAMLRVVEKLNRQATQAEAHTKELEEIRKASSTRYLSAFPGYFEDIVELLRQAKESIVIFCDFPAYGSFSNRAAFLSYRYLLEQKLEEGIPVEVTFLVREARREIAREQFSAGIDWEAKKRSPDFGPRLKAFAEAHGWTTSVADLTFDGFLELIEKEDDLMETEFLSKAHRFPIERHVPIYFWLVDGNRAIFSIASLSAKAIEHGFTTFDQKLISAFEDMRRRYDYPTGATPVAARSARPAGHGAPERGGLTASAASAVPAG